jgi:succinate dehydrogenase / fumarate reductase membrane anchor subunit
MADRMRSPLGRVYGLGSAREGAREWWSMRLGALALIPLGLWWVAEIIGHAGADYAGFRQWVASPVTAILLILTIAVTFRHTAQGVREVIEDYVHHEGVKLAALVALRFACVALAVAGIYAVLAIAFGH